jgi:hypothetical protein
LPNIIQNGSNSIREAVQTEEPWPEPFLEEPELRQTSSDYFYIAIAGAAP